MITFDFSDLERSVSRSQCLRLVWGNSVHFRILTALCEWLHSYLSSRFMPSRHLNWTFSSLTVKWPSRTPRPLGLLFYYVTIQYDSGLEKNIFWSPKWIFTHDGSVFRRKRRWKMWQKWYYAIFVIYLFICNWHNIVSCCTVYSLPIWNLHVNY